MIQQTTRNNNAMYAVPRESRAYVGNEGSYYVGEGSKAANPNRLALGKPG
jgi:hypothetical protein